MVFVCYQAEGSLGNKIQKGENEVTIDNAQYNVKVSISTIAGLSGHADRTELINYMQKIKPKPRKVLVMHGENSKCLDLASSIHKAFKVETVAPRNLDTLRLR